MHREPPSSLRTSLALRQGIWRKGDPHWHICGIPEVLYTDNGSDFTSRHTEQVAAKLRMRLVFSIPGKPQGRGRIEPFFRTVNEMFLCDLDGYTRCTARRELVARPLRSSVPQRAAGGVSPAFQFRR